MTLLVVCVSSLLAGSAVYAQLKPGSCNEYVGTLGKTTQIGLSLAATHKGLEGSYFYEKHLQDIALTGQYISARDIALLEADSINQPRGKFLLRFVERDDHFQSAEPLQSEVLQGHWTSADGKSSYPVYLRAEHNCAPAGQNRYAVAGATNDATVEKNAQAFYNAVLTGKRDVAAKYVAYPVTFFANDKQRSISGPADFLKEYDRIFTTAFTARIEKGVPHHMFANSQGIMLADGAVWFDEEGKAKHFNNAPPAQ